MPAHHKAQIEVTNRKNLLHQEPSVINEKLIRSSLRALLPRGEKGLYAREQGVNEREAEHLLIEFESIAVIANISHMVALKKLQLCNNVIVEISGLDQLVNLTHLDLSYNSIKKISNLEKLHKLETLNLHRNLISNIENLDNQLRMEIFIISSNALNNSENLKYLRGFPRLAVLVIEGNPICDEPNFRPFLLAHLPDIVILDYLRIKRGEIQTALVKYSTKLEKLIAIEENAKRRASLVEAEEEQKIIYSKAFIDGFEGDEFWNTLYQDDTHGQIILQINEIDEIRATYHELFRRASQELFAKGMKAYNLRQDEYKAFNTAIKEIKDVVKFKGQHLTEEFTDWNRGMMREMRGIVLVLDEIERNITMNASAADEHNTNALAEAHKVQVEKAAHEDRLQKLVLEFTRKLHYLWYTMLSDEVELNEQISEVGGELARSIRELVVGWLEQLRAHFAQLRDVQIQYHDRLVESLVTYGEFRASDTSIPEHLKALLIDKEALGAVVQQSHEHHSSVIDQREEGMTANLKKWLETATNNIQADELGRSRRRIVEISHYVDTHTVQLYKFKIMSHIKGYVPEVRADQDKIPKKWRKKLLKEKEKEEALLKLQQQQASSKKSIPTTDKSQLQIMNESKKAIGEMSRAESQKSTKIQHQSK